MIGATECERSVAFCVSVEVFDLKDCTQNYILLGASLVCIIFLIYRL